MFKLAVSKDDINEHPMQPMSYWFYLQIGVPVLADLVEVGQELPICISRVKL
jgi:hypothetical protein